MTGPGRDRRRGTGSAPPPAGELARRARMHAALGDPSRLAVTDLLALGDLSPGEIGTRLDIPGNLLAHHLRVLEAAGVVRRLRSEGDARRVYVSLAVAPPGSPVPRLPRVDRVVFVCTRNSARSQFAAALWRASSAVAVASAGTAPAETVHPAAVAVGAAHGLRLAGVRPADVRDVLAGEPGDLVVAVCDAAHEILASVRADAGPRLHWSVPDPVRGSSPRAFESALDDLRARVTRLAPAVVPRRPARDIGP
jgi:ArsR family transcriptional regulator, arsenate/arsenite/antimonite-responsive transcriptional repressor / arsenate reductase (thioredoxin)